MLTPEDARARVAKGAALLDQMRPGWASTIDVGVLDISSCYQCVIGQLSGGEESSRKHTLTAAEFGHPHIHEQAQRQVQ